MDSKKLMKIVGTIGVVVVGVYFGNMAYNRFPPKKMRTTTTANGSK